MTERKTKATHAGRTQALRKAEFDVSRAHRRRERVLVEMYPVGTVVWVERRHAHGVKTHPMQVIYHYDWDVLARLRGRDINTGREWNFAWTDIRGIVDESDGKS